MTDQQKGYGLGIILGIRLPCPRGARAALCVRQWQARAGHTSALARRRAIVSVHQRASVPVYKRAGMPVCQCCGGARTPASLYPHITSTYIPRDKFDQKFNTVCVENNNIGRYYFMVLSPRYNRTRSSVTIFCASIYENRSVKEWLSSKIYLE